MSAFLKKLEGLYAEIGALRRDVSALKTKQVSRLEIRQRARDLGSRWFSEFEPELRSTFSFSPDLISGYSNGFQHLIKISAPNNLKASYLGTLTQLRKSFRADFLIPIETTSSPASSLSALSKVLSALPDSVVGEYLEEAVKCATRGHLRAAAVLGWCAAIDQIHRAIERKGFATFNHTSVSMTQQKVGRFKRFSKTFTINSMSELREVFDTDVLWVLEGMQMLDVNQHTRLRSCFDLRNQCAHPGEAPVTEFNLMSFFSDLNLIVFRNPRFASSSVGAAS